MPQFVIDELQTLADANDKLKRERGRRGLDVIRELQANPRVDVSIDTADGDGHGVDQMLINLATRQSLRIVTTDYNLNKVGEIQGLTILNLNDLANSVRPQVLPGEQLVVEIVKTGEGADQGVGYLPDGTMVVVEAAASRVGHRVSIEVTNALQTSAGRMVFGRLGASSPSADAEAPSSPDSSPDAGPDSGSESGSESTAAQMARSATQQPRTSGRPSRRGDQTSRRNPRR